MANNHKNSSNRATFAGRMSISAAGSPEDQVFHRDASLLRRSSGRQDAARARHVTTAEAAEYLGLSESYLNKARHFGTGPAYVRFGRAIRYSRDALDDWAEQRTTTSTRDG